MMQYSRLALFVAMAGLAAKAGAQDDEPDLSFLEYLGSWQESDEEWLIVAEMELEEEHKGEHEASDEDEASVSDTKAGETDDADQK